jgi:hypothetical protein
MVARLATRAPVNAGGVPFVGRDMRSIVLVFGLVACGSVGDPLFGNTPVIPDAGDVQALDAGDVQALDAGDVQALDAGDVVATGGAGGVQALDAGPRCAAVDVRPVTLGTCNWSACRERCAASCLAAPNLSAGPPLVCRCGATPVSCP